MKVLPKDIENFILNIPAKVKAILLYGPDSGLVRTRISLITKSRTISDKLHYDQIKNNPSILLDSLNSLSLFGENLAKEKVAIIECTGTGISESYSTMLKNPNYKGLLLFCAGDLGTDSALRKFFENNENIAAIPCYLDDAVAIGKLIQQILKQNQKTIDPKANQLLMNCIAIGDRMLIINEIEKICLFLADKKHIVEEDLQGYLESQGEVSFDRLCYKMSLKEIKELEPLLIKLQNEGHNLVSITRVLNRHFYRLYQVKTLIIQGKEEQQAMNSLYPPVFFKQVNDFTRSIKLWSDVALLDILKKLTKLELMAKKNPITAELMLKNIMIQIILPHTYTSHTSKVLKELEANSTTIDS